MADRPGICIGILLCALAACAQETPTWWKAMEKLPRLECAFVQESESAVFGKLRKEGRIQAARGGFLRATYAKGLLLVADGRTLIQYDMNTHTAQRMDLRAAAGDAPLLAMLLDTALLRPSYELKPAGPDRLRLEPRRKGLPAIDLEGHGGFLKRATWTDPTGARQVLELKDIKTPGAFAPGTFKFQAPQGTRWIEPR